MISIDDARERALTALPDDVAITDEQEFDVGWVFTYQSKQYLETHEFRHMLMGNAPILVDRHDGSVHMTGTARSIDDYVQRYRDDSVNDNDDDDDC